MPAALLRAGISQFGGRAGKAALSTGQALAKTGKTLWNKADLAGRAKNLFQAGKTSGRTVMGHVSTMSPRNIQIASRGIGFGVGAGFGYLTSSDDASGAQVLERTIGMGFLGAMGGAVSGKLLSSPAARSGVRSAAGKFKGMVGEYETIGNKSTGFSIGYAGVFRRRQFGRRYTTGDEFISLGSQTKAAPFMAGRKEAFQAGMGELDKVGLRPRFGYKQSILAGGLYGAIDEDESVISGAAAGAGMRFGAGRMVGMSGRFAGAAKTPGFRNKLKEMPLITGGATLGATLGIYSNLGEEGSILGGAIRGGIVGGGLGTIGSAAAYSPMGTLAGLGGAAVAGGGMLEGALYGMQSGVEPFRDLDADGDLALALHKTRHGY